MLCSGQSSRVQGNSDSTIFAVLLEETGTFHTVRAALQAQSSLSVGLSHKAVAQAATGCPPALPLPTASHWQHPVILSLLVGTWPSDRVLRVREGAWQQALGLTFHCWEMKQSEGPGTLHQSDSLHRMGSAEGWALKADGPHTFHMMGQSTGGSQPHHWGVHGSALEGTCPVCAQQTHPCWTQATGG